MSRRFRRGIPLLALALVALAGAWTYGPVGRGGSTPSVLFSVEGVAVEGIEASLRATVMRPTLAAPSREKTMNRILESSGFPRTEWSVAGLRVRADGRQLRVEDGESGAFARALRIEAMARTGASPVTLEIDEIELRAPSGRVYRSPQRTTLVIAVSPFSEEDPRHLLARAHGRIGNLVARHGELRASFERARRSREGPGPAELRSQLQRMVLESSEDFAYLRENLAELARLLERSRGHGASTRAGWSLAEVGRLRALARWESLAAQVEALEPDWGEDLSRFRTVDAIGLTLRADARDFDTALLAQSVSRLSWRALFEVLGDGGAPFPVAEARAFAVHFESFGGGTARPFEDRLAEWTDLAERSRSRCGWPRWAPAVDLRLRCPPDASVLGAATRERDLGIRAAMLRVRADLEEEVLRTGRRPDRWETPPEIDYVPHRNGFELRMKGSGTVLRRDDPIGPARPSRTASPEVQSAPRVHRSPG